MHFVTALFERRWLKEVVAIEGVSAIKQALDVEEKDAVMISAYASFTNLLGLKRALAEMLPVAVGQV